MQGLTTTAPDWGEHSAWVRHLLRGMVRDPHLADDIAQDALVAGLELSGDAPDRPRAWLRRVTRNLLAKRLRGDANRSAREQAAHPEAPPTPEAIAERVERQQIIAREVLALPEAYKNVLLLHYHEGAGIQEIAERLDAPPRTIQTRLHRARGLLRERLRSKHGEQWAALFLPLAMLKESATPLLGSSSGTSGSGASAGATLTFGRPRTSAGKLTTKLLGGASVAAAAWLAIDLTAEELPPSRSPNAGPSPTVAAAAALSDGPGQSATRPRVEVPAPEQDPAPVKPQVGTLAGRLQVPIPAELGQTRFAWGVRTRRRTDEMKDPTSPWEVADSASTWDHRPNSPDRLMPRTGLWLPGQGAGTHAYTRRGGAFKLGPLLAGRYDVLVERDGVPVAILPNVAVGPDAKADPRLDPIVVADHCRTMTLDVTQADAPAWARVFVVFGDGSYYRPFHGQKGEFAVHCPRGTAPDLVVTNGGSRPQRLRWRDGKATVRLEPCIDVYLQAARPVEVKKAVQMPYAIFVPTQPVLGLPPEAFGTLFDIRLLAEGKTVKVPAHTTGPHSLRLQTGSIGERRPFVGSFKKELAIPTHVAEPERIAATVVTLPDPIQRPKGARGSYYVRLPNRVVDLEALIRAQGK